MRQIDWKRPEGRIWMFYFNVLSILQRRGRYAVKTEWIRDYIVPLTLKTLEKRAVESVGVETDNWGRTMRCANFLHMAEFEFEIIRAQIPDMFTFETDAARLVKVMNFFDEYYRKDERVLIEAVTIEVTKLCLSNMPYEKAEIKLGRGVKGRGPDNTRSARSGA